MTWMSRPNQDPSAVEKLPDHPLIHPMSPAPPNAKRTDAEERQGHPTWRGDVTALLVIRSTVLLRLRRVVSLRE